MEQKPLSIEYFPRAILHIDGDAFFASCEQSLNPKLKGKPVVCGKERGIAASMSYEAKAKGITRGMPVYQIKKICPEAILLPSDYETYSLLSKRLYSIVRRYTPQVEEYGIDECFADLTGLRRPLRMNYTNMAMAIKKELDQELGFTFSVGLGPNKVIAKIASKHKKPSGFTAIPARHIHLYTKNLPIEKIWGIGPQTESFLKKENIFTALDFAKKNESWVKKKLTKPHYEIWQELNGNFVKELETEQKKKFYSIQKTKTFTPPSRDKKFVFAQLSKNVENACIKARRYNQQAKKIIFFLRTQEFSHKGFEMELSNPTSFPNEIIANLEPAFEKIFDPRLLWRATGVVLFELNEKNYSQLDLFGQVVFAKKMQSLFESVDQLKKKYGKHTVFLGSSFLANKFAQHLGLRGDLPKRKTSFLKGETTRKHLAIPLIDAKI